MIKAIKKTSFFKKIGRKHLAIFSQKTLTLPAFAQSLSKKSYLICCVVTIKQFNLLQNMDLIKLQKKHLLLANSILHSKLVTQSQ